MLPVGEAPIARQPLERPAPPMTEEEIRSTVLNVLGDSGCVFYTASKKPDNEFIKDKLIEHYDWPNTEFLPQGGETPGKWIPQLEQEIQHAVQCGVFGLRESSGFLTRKFPHGRVLILFDNYNAVGGQGDGPFTLNPGLYDSYARLFSLGRRWQSPIYVCSASAARWHMDSSIDGIGDTLRKMAQAEGWMTHRAEGLWEALSGSVRPGNLWRHNVS